MSFFIPGPRSDDLYLAIRDGTSHLSSEARNFVEHLWTQCGPYLDEDFRRQAASRYETRFWEMYLAWTLLENGVELDRPSGRRRAPGPDFRTAHSETWIEAVLATPGVGDNKVPDRSSGEDRWFPEEEIILRLRNSIHEKAEKYEKYVGSGLVSESDSFIIAVGTRRSNLGMLESSPPRIVSALFPIGPSQLLIERDTGKVSGQSRQYRPSVFTAAGSPVSTNIFQDEAYRGISGVLYAGVDELNRPSQPGPEFVFVHNPLATVPVPEGLFPFGVEYRKVGSRLEGKKHPMC